MIQIDGRRDRWLPSIVALCFLVLAACGKQDRPDGSGDAARANGAGGEFVWSAVEGAERYRVQGWAEDRLLFDETTWEPRLRATPSIERTLAPFEGVRLRVRALDGDGHAIGDAVEFDAEAIRRPAS